MDQGQCGTWKDTTWRGIMDGPCAWEGNTFLDKDSVFTMSFEHVRTHSEPHTDVRPLANANVNKRSVPSTRTSKFLGSHTIDKVIGQPEAIAAVTSAIQISRTGLGNANRPTACLLFTGASGTGKTLLAKAVS